MWITFLSVLILQLLTPFWWWIIIIPYLYGAIGARSGWHAFRTGAFSVGLLWLLAAVFFLFTDAQIIVTRVANMVEFLSRPLLLVLTTAIGLICAGCSSLSGYYFSKIIRRPNAKPRDKLESPVEQ
ncbi:MAG: hypothetical protein GWN16_11585 [Calditrichae bacterium]|nr:hypothetical protein [Calditrichia bacterium]